MNRDTWTRAARSAVRWFCTYCGRLNPDITRTCLGCHQ